MLELELKYLTPPGLNKRKQIKKMLKGAGVVVGEPTTQKIIDVYYDSAAEDLYKTGWTLRIRRAGKKTKATLKQLGTAPSVFERHEVTQAISPDILDKPYLSSLVVNRLIPGLLPQDIVLQPLFKQVTKRRNRHLTHPSFANTNVIWSEDHVKLSGYAYQAYVEHEFELCGPNNALLAWISQHLDTHKHIYPSLMSKFERGYHYVGPAWRALAGEEDTVPAVDSWSELAMRTFNRNLLGLTHSAAFAHEAAHIEGVHQMRIWTRRTRAALGLFRDTLPKQARKAMADHLRHLTRVSTPVRDADVAIKKIGKTQQLRADKLGGAAVEKYIDDLVAKRAVAHEELRRTLNSDVESINNLWKQLQPLKPTCMDVQTGFRTQVVPQLRSVLQQGSQLENYQLTPAALHALRKRCRSLGYHLDIVGEVQENKLQLKVLREELAKLLVHMGKHQDAVVAQRQIEKQLKQAKKAKAKALTKLRGDAKSRAQKSQKRVRKTWRRFARAAQAVS